MKKANIKLVFVFIIVISHTYLYAQDIKNNINKKQTDITRSESLMRPLMSASGKTIPEQENITDKINLQFSGFIKLEAFYDNTEVAQGDWLLYVNPGNSPKADQSVFSMNARHSRICMNMEGPSIGKDGKINGYIEVDFGGGFPNSSTAARQPQLRMRHAWAEINYPAWEARFGQDWALISGPFPNTTSFVVGAGKGNLWMRYPQIRYTIKRNPVKFSVSINRPMAGNTKYNDFAGGDFDIVSDGERSGLPWIMGRLWYNMGEKTVSVSGHVGKEQIDDLSGKHHCMKTMSFNTDLQVTSGPVSVTARAFYGENLNSFFGGVFQGFTRDSTSVSNIASRGGWGQLVYKFDDSWSATIGGGTDDPDDNDLVPGNRSRNDWLFGNVSLSIEKALVFMLEADFLKTSYIGNKAGKNTRIQFVTYYKF